MSKNSEPQSPKGALAASDADDLPEQLRIRRAKRASIIERGLEPYPVSVPRTKTLKELRDAHKDLAIDVTTGITESVTGRIILKRDTGKLCFATHQKMTKINQQGRRKQTCSYLKHDVLSKNEIHCYRKRIWQCI